MLVLSSLVKPLSVCVVFAFVSQASLSVCVGFAFVSQASEYMCWFCLR